MFRIFTNEGIGNVNGMFSIDHLIYVILAFILLFFLLFYTRKDDNKIAFKRIKTIGIVVFILEILKIIWNLTIRKDVKPTDYIPLYFCSIFIYASLGFTFIKGKNKFSYYLKDCSRCFLIYGGLVGGIVFMVFPSTALPLHPLLHILTLHSLVFHTLMVFVSVYMIKHFSKVSLKDFKPYIVYLTFFSCFCLILNYIFNLNFMLLNDPFGVPILTEIHQLVNGFYPFIVILGQNIGSFFLSFGFFKLIEQIKRRR